MVSQQTAIKTAQSFVQECKSIGLTFEKVLLFGSHVDGKTHDGSDIDLALISKKFTDDLFSNIRQYASVNIHYPSIETHPFSLKQLMDGNDFLDQIIKQGIEIK